MEILKITKEVEDVLKFLQTKELKPDEKIAILKSAAATIENILTSEHLQMLIARTFIK